MNNKLSPLAALIISMIFTIIVAIVILLHVEANLRILHNLNIKWVMKTTTLIFCAAVVVYLAYFVKDVFFSNKENSDDWTYKTLTSN